MTTSYTLFWIRDDEQAECKHKNNRHVSIKRALACQAAAFGMVDHTDIRHADGTPLTEAEDAEIGRLITA